MGDVDYRLLTAFVRSIRANADGASERCGRDDVAELLSLAEREPSKPEETRAATVHSLPLREGL